MYRNLLTLLRKLLTKLCFCNCKSACYLNYSRKHREICITRNYTFYQKRGKYLEKKIKAFHIYDFPGISVCNSRDIISRFCCIFNRLDLCNVFHLKILSRCFSFLKALLHTQISSLFARPCHESRQYFMHIYGPTHAA